MKRLFADKVSLICVILGIALLLGGVVVLVSMEVSASHSPRDTQQLLEKVQALIPQPVSKVPQERGNNAMAARQIDGINVGGILEFPKYGRTLPVASGWDTSLVESLPCRFTGSIYDRSLIIGAVDGEGQISFAASMDAGDVIYLTDMEGGRYAYRVTAIHHAKHATLEKLQSGDYALTIFVKDSKTAEYLLIRCQTESEAAR